MLTVMHRGFVFALMGSAAMLVTPLVGAAQTLLPAQSEVTFVAKQLGVPLQGKFKRFQSDVVFDPKNTAASRIMFEVDLGSVSMNPDADAELPKADWFHASKFPKAQFQSKIVKALGGGKFQVTGQLRIKGSSRDVSVPVTVVQANGLSTATGALVLKRLDYKIGDGDWKDTSIVANDVQVNFKLVLQGVPAL